MIPDGHLEDAEAAFRAALAVRSRGRDALGWAWTQTGLAKTVAEIGARTGDPARWREVLGFAEAALEVFEAAGASHRAAEARGARDAIRAKLMDGR